jgi:hypothetical protein
LQFFKKHGVVVTDDPKMATVSHFREQAISNISKLITSDFCDHSTWSPTP